MYSLQTTFIKDYPYATTTTEGIIITLSDLRVAGIRYIYTVMCHLYLLLLFCLFFGERKEIYG